MDRLGILAKDVEIDVLRAEWPDRRFQRLHRRIAIAVAAMLFVGADEVCRRFSRGLLWIKQKCCLWRYNGLGLCQ
ncbi:MAG TPA: hypothetical protein VF040_16155 [Ktedonobacterales bacterium]